MSILKIYAKYLRYISRHEDIHVIIATFMVIIAGFVFLMLWFAFLVGELGFVSVLYYAALIPAPIYAAHFIAFAIWVKGGDT